MQFGRSSLDCSDETAEVGGCASQEASVKDVARKHTWKNCTRAPQICQDAIQRETPRARSTLRGAQWRYKSHPKKRSAKTFRRWLFEAAVPFWKPYDAGAARRHPAEMRDAIGSESAILRM
jgi:hypothetical protein